ncbi:zinc transporter ZIP12-like isoform X1 [Branchiostoma floridae]|uniref:Zinc transporter ZIP12-like isoform X1 n=2 Tax=Branchiostoma floridae TaxID=7739 RepID=A0A9J7KST0_BRAFL|nr:zinc transporter ZIP12-like isoform X1 [Branchiostoma floridae]XP_035669877.1 zinc transporter ZIP12-like isoform X1 [Branchiostoma floridae]XP_035669878.1 zinc transporter ZIP12-like isoform X1 [Branchiostoma floridae]XP_035669879.1 zinc transporter ZIP12-like isoform X1 [Branchiostoma floridae]
MERTLWIGVLTVLCGLAASQHDGHDHEHGQDPFTAVLHLLGGDENQNLTLDMSTSLVKTMLDRVRCLRLEADEDRNFTCAECLTADGLIELSLGGPTDIVDEEGFHKMAVVLTVFLTDVSAHGVCTEDPGGKGYQTMEDNLMRYTQSKFTLSSYQQVLKDINTNYRVENWGKCFTAESVFEELHINTSEASGGASYAELREIAAITVANVLEGLCIGEAELPEKSFFVDSLFKSLNVTNGTITVEALEHILSAFGIGGEAPPEPPVVDDGHDHAGHDHRRRRDLPPLTREDEHDHNHSHEHTEDFHHTCFNSAQLMKLFLVEAEMGVTRDQFSAMAPALLQQVYSGVCVGETPTPNTTAAPVVGELTMLEKYGYGTLSVFLISLLALIGLLVLPMAGSSVYKFIVQLGVGLGVGALSGDALLHLLPQALGLHGDHAAHADHDHGAEDIAYMWKLLVAMGGIYFFFVFERVMSFIMPGGHGHSHGHHEEEHVHEDVQLKKMSKLPPEPSMGSKSLSISKQQLTNGQSTTTLDVFPEMSGEADTPNCCSAGCTPTAMMIVFSDTLHNLTDGLALGIAFSGDLAVGLSTSIAVLAHELPHELGDFAMLIRCGMSYKGALLWNLFAACWCFVGLYIGLAIGASFEVRQWLFALIAGMFLYVSLVDMLPELLHHKSKSPIATFVGQNIGFLLGVAALVALAMYEEQIQLAITLG